MLVNLSSGTRTPQQQMQRSETTQPLFAAAHLTCPSLFIIGGIKLEINEQHLSMCQLII